MTAPASGTVARTRLKYEIRPLIEKYLDQHPEIVGQVRSFGTSLSALAGSATSAPADAAPQRQPQPQSQPESQPQPQPQPAEPVQPVAVAVAAQAEVKPTWQPATPTAGPRIGASRSSDTPPSIVSESPPQTESVPEQRNGTREASEIVLDVAEHIRTLNGEIASNVPPETFQRLVTEVLAERVAARRR